MNTSSYNPIGIKLIVKKNMKGSRIMNNMRHCIDKILYAKKIKIISCYISILFIIISSQNAFSASNDIPLYGAYEISLNTTNTYTTPYSDVTVSAVFQGPSKTIEIEGFWDGGSTWKIRMAPTEIGTWTIKSVASNDNQLNRQGEGASFSVHIPTALEKSVNNVLEHGFVKVNPDFPHTFMYSDGSPFFFMGDTQWPRVFWGPHFANGDFQSLVDHRVNDGFNIFTLAFLGVDYNATASNEGGRIFFDDHPGQKINPEFFQWADKRIQYMNQKNIRPMIVLGAPDNQLTTDAAWLSYFQRYLIARWAAYDVIWFGIKEYQESSNGTAIAQALGKTILQYDPYHHLTSIHPGGDSSSDEFSSDTWLSFNSLQRGGLAMIKQDYNVLKPVVQTESLYEYPSGCSGANDFGNPKNLLREIWGTQLHGGWNAGYELEAGCNNDDYNYYLNHMNTTSVKYHTYLKRFFTQQSEFWKLVPNNNLSTSSNVWAAAQLGKEFVFYIQGNSSSSISIDADLSSTNSVLNVQWYNPSTGTVLTSNTSTVTGGGIKNFQTPDSNDWVLHIFSDQIAPIPTTIDQNSPAAPIGLQLKLN